MCVCVFLRHGLLCKRRQCRFITRSVNQYNEDREKKWKQIFSEAKNWDKNTFCAHTHTKFCLILFHSSCYFSNLFVLLKKNIFQNWNKYFLIFCLHLKLKFCNLKYKGKEKSRPIINVFVNLLDQWCERDLLSSYTFLSITMWKIEWSLIRFEIFLSLFHISINQWSVSFNNYSVWQRPKLGWDHNNDIFWGIWKKTKSVIPKAPC